MITGESAGQIIRPSCRAVVWGHDKWEWPHSSVASCFSSTQLHADSVSLALVKRVIDCLISQRC